MAEMIAETVWQVSTWVVQQPNEMMLYHIVSYGMRSPHVSDVSG